MVLKNLNKNKKGVMIEVLYDSIDNIDNNISVNDILIQNMVNPISEEEFNRLSQYYESLKRACLIDLVNYGHYYDKSKYDFYFNIGDASKGWYKKLILKSNIVDLVLKHRIINFLVLKYYGNK
jgi:hypothetical protein